MSNRFRMSNVIMHGQGGLQSVGLQSDLEYPISDLTMCGLRAYNLLAHMLVAYSSGADSLGAYTLILGE